MHNDFLSTLSFASESPSLRVHSGDLLLWSLYIAIKLLSSIIIIVLEVDHLFSPILIDLEKAANTLC